MTVCESGTASPSKLMLFTMPRFSILKTRTRSSSHVSKEDAPAEERTDEVVCAEEEYLTSLGVLDEDVDIKIFWGGGKTDGII
ncbi:unnamed protein product [Rhizophagus irregularis]|nr:unnamed protein product [Rhizophagus irregularis]